MKYVIIFSLLLLTACNGLTVPNVEVCADEGKYGAFCKYTRSERTRELTKGQWDAIRPGYFCMSAPAYGSYQRFIEQACNQEKSCIDEAEQEFSSFVRNMKKHR